MASLKFYSAMAVAALALVTPPFASSVMAFSNAELCEAVFREYGVRSDACSAPPDVEETAAPRHASEISPSQRDNHVFFLKGGSRLDPSEIQQIALLAAVLNTEAMQATCLHLVGHSDSSGATSANLALSEKRAEAVAEQLRARLQGGSRVMQVSGVGEAEPLDGFVPTSRYNRRVAILARTCAP